MPTIGKSCEGFSADFGSDPTAGAEVFFEERARNCATEDFGADRPEVFLFGRPVTFDNQVKGDSR